jgi:hypothetical protein
MNTGIIILTRMKTLMNIRRIKGKSMTAGMPLKSLVNMTAPILDVKRNMEVKAV